MSSLVLADPRDTLRDNLVFLREYARRVLVELDESLTPLNDVKTALVQDVWQAGHCYGLSERDLVVMIFTGVFGRSGDRRGL